MQGMETLPLRMEHHCDNAPAVAKFLSEHEKVSWLSYGRLEDHPKHNLALKHLEGKPSALLTFGLQGGYEAAVRFYAALKMLKRLVNIGDTKSLACHPASTAHRQMTADEQIAAGISQEMLRLCIGIEHIAHIKVTSAKH